MKKTDKEVIDYAIRIVKKYGIDNENIYRSFSNFWIKNKLTQKQCIFLDEIKDALTGPSAMEGLYIDQGYPKRIK